MRIVERFFDEVVSKHDDKAAKRLLDPKVVVHGAEDGDTLGLNPTMRVLAGLHGFLPGFEVDLDSSIVFGNLVVARWSGHAWITARWPIPLMEMEVPGAVSMFRIEGGRIAEIWSLDPSLESDTLEDDDDDGPVGGAPPGPRWVPPEPKPRPK